MTLNGDWNGPKYGGKDNENYTIPTLASCITCIYSFHLWIFCVGYDTFVMVITSSIIHGCPPMWLLGFLKCITQQVQPC
jgi:hypothetical protein